MSLKSLPDTVLETLFSSFSQIRTFLISFSMDLGTHDLQDSQNTNTTKNFAIILTTR